MFHLYMCVCLMSVSWRVSVESCTASRETAVENVRLKHNNEGLSRELEHTTQELSLAQEQLLLLQEQSSRLHEERERDDMPICLYSE